MRSSLSHRFSREAFFSDLTSQLKQTHKIKAQNPIFFSTSIVSKFTLESTLREVVSNFQESGDRSKNSTLFLFAPKDPFGELFSKIVLKSSSEFLF